MAENMVERVARAIMRPHCDANAGGDHSIMSRPSYRFCIDCGTTIKKSTLTMFEARLAARAAIEAMREPTEEMVAAGFGAVYDIHSERGTADGVWVAKTDAALKAPSR